MICKGLISLIELLEIIKRKTYKPIEKWTKVMNNQLTEKQIQRV